MSDAGKAEHDDGVGWGEYGKVLKREADYNMAITSSPQPDHLANARGPFFAGRSLGS